MSAPSSLPSKVQQFPVLGVPINATSIPDTIARICAWADDDTGRYIGVREVPSLMALKSTQAGLEVARGAAMNVPDGMPLVWIGKAYGLQIERTCGPDMMRALCADPSIKLKHFLYGGQEGVADKLAGALREMNPEIEIVGTHCPPFRTLTDAEATAVQQKINDSGADVVWVGISSPKQDFWMYANHTALSQTCVGVGAAFDFLTGSVARAPVWMQKAGLEWLFRLTREPRRLWYRYLVLAPSFIAQVVPELIRNKISGKVSANG